MTDDLSDLKALMDEATPRPDAQRRQEDLSRASANFARLHAPKVSAKPVSFWSRGTAWVGGTVASVAVVATAFLLFVPSSTPVPLGPMSADIGDARAETASDFAIATQEAPQTLSRSAAAPTALATESAMPPPKTAALLADTALSYQQIDQLLQDGIFPDRAVVEVSAMLSGIAESLLQGTDPAPVTSLPTPWNSGSHLVLVASVSSGVNSTLPLDETWRLLGVVQRNQGAIEIYQAPVAFGAQANEATYFAAAVTGFALLLQGDASFDGWSFDEAIDLAQRGINDDPARLDMLDLMERAEELSR